MSDPMQEFESKLRKYGIAETCVGNGYGLVERGVARAAVIALYAAALAEVERLQAHILERTNFNTRVLRERNKALARAEAAEKERDAARFDSCFYKAGISAVAIKLRERAAKELHQPRGHDMDAREWACTLLEGAAEDIEVNYPRKPERPAEPPVDDYDERGLPVGWAAEPPVGMRAHYRLMPGVNRLWSQSIPPNVSPDYKFDHQGEWTAIGIDFTAAFFNRREDAELFLSAALTSRPTGEKSA